jgi:guanine deaminase
VTDRNLGPSFLGKPAQRPVHPRYVVERRHGSRIGTSGHVLDPTRGTSACNASPVSDVRWLGRAIELAVENAAAGGRPFGAVVVLDGRVVGEGVNGYVADNDPTAHAEIAAIRAATRGLGTARLDGAVLVASTEPCPMCQAAALLAGVGRVVFATTEAQAAARGYDAREFLADLARPFEERRIMSLEHVVVGDEVVPYARAEEYARHHD